MQTIFKEIFKKEFIKEIQSFSGEVFLVGGCVRDYLLKTVSKDIDMVIRLLPFEKINEILSKYGSVNLVGESFGVIKFKEFNTNLEIEFALPRQDSKISNEKGHKSILAQSNLNLSLPLDLGRRDITINALALDSNLNLIDPYNGLLDLNNHLIHPVFTETFIDDPLRMLRAIGFAARFDFQLTKECHDLIEKNKSLIKDISKERVLMELQKVIDKQGDCFKLVTLLYSTGLLKELFGFEDGYKFLFEDYNKIFSISEFLFLIANKSDILNLSDFYFKTLKIDNKTSKELKCLEYLFSNIDKCETKQDYNRLFYNCLQKAPWFLESKLLDVKNTIIKKQFKEGKYPLSIKNILLTGDDLIKLGLKGIEIGRMQKKLLDAILNDEFKFNTLECYRFVKRNLK